MKRQSAHDSGFTIIEVVIAMGLFLIGISSILGLLAFGATMTRTAALRTDAASAAEAVLADLEERLFPLVEEDGELVAGAPAPIVDRPLPERPDVVYSATPVPNPAGIAHPGETLEYRVDVVVAWTSGGVRRTRAFSALLLRQVPFGERMRRMFVAETP